MRRLLLILLPNAQDFLPEAQLSSRILAGLLANFSKARLPIHKEQWHPCASP